MTHAGTRLYLLVEDEGVVHLDPATGEQVAEPIYAVVRIDPATGEQVGEPIVVGGLVIWVSESPDGRRLAITSYSDERGDLLTMVDVAGWRITRSGNLLTGPPVLLDDGTMIGSRDNRMMRFDTETYDQVGSLPGTAGGLGVPETSDDGRTMVMSAGAGITLLHDTATGIRLAEPFFHDSPDYVGSALRPDGLELAISEDAGIAIWDLDPEHQFAAVCRIAGRDLTEHEWRTYLDGLGELRSTCGSD